MAQSPPGCIASVDHSAGNSSTTTTPSTNITTPSTATATARAASAPSRPPLVDFDVLREYIIPRQAFCNRYVTITTPDGKYSILGYPVLIPNPKYLRNEFIFNFGIIVEADVDQISYERVVRRLASTFAEMEKQNEYLSQGENKALIASVGKPSLAADEDGVGGRRPIEGLLEIIKEDLNNYGECMIPVGELPSPSILPPQDHSLTWNQTRPIP